jgi:hypothetical protein
MKKMMKENAQTLLEFERALARKSGECNVRFSSSSTSLRYLTDSLGTIISSTRVGDGVAKI